MKHLYKKISCSILSFILILCTVLPVAAVENTTQTSVAQEPKIFADAVIAEYPAIDSELAATIKELLRTAVINCETSLDIHQYNIPYSQALLNAFYAMTVYEIAEAFHLSSFRCTYFNGIFLEFQLDYVCTGDEYAAQYEACMNAANKLLSGIKNNSNLTDIEKALLLHDRLALHCSYGDVFADRYETATLYGALVNRQPVCQGYAIAYSYLLDQVGIKSELVSSEKLNHAWNIVYIDNKPYHVDVTWDDPTADIYGRVLQNNFPLSTSALKSGVNDSSPHLANDYTSTPVDTTYDSYFWQNSETAFQLLNGEIYYIDNIAEEIRRLSDKTTVCSVAGKWYISTEGYFLIGNFAKLACANNTLYCSMPTAVYAVNTQNGTMTEFAKPTLKINGETFYSIRGFAYEDNLLYFDYCNIVAEKIHSEKMIVAASAPDCIHAATQIQNKVNATCITNGYTGDHYCKSCGIKIAEGSIIPATDDHTWNAGVLTTPSTCHTTGVRTFTCTVCEAIQTQTVEIDAENHTGGTEIVGMLDTICGTDGYTGDTVCLGCEAILETGSVIPASGTHSWDSGTITTEPTCHTTGIRTFTCTTCAATMTNSVAVNKDNHDGEKAITNEIAPTCQTNGYSGDTICRGCNEILTKGVSVPASDDHAWDSGIITIPPTQNSAGEKTYTCTLCGKTKTESVEMNNEFIDKNGMAIVDEDGDILAVSDTTVAQYLAQANADSTITDSNGNALADNAIPGTGSMLIMPNGTQYLIIVLGDVNGDGKILANDARTTLRASVGLDSTTDTQCKAGDVTGDGLVSASDARSILRASVGLDNPGSWLA